MRHHRRSGGAAPRPRHRVTAPAASGGPPPGNSVRGQAPKSAVTSSDHSGIDTPEERTPRMVSIHSPVMAGTRTFLTRPVGELPGRRRQEPACPDDHPTSPTVLPVFAAGGKEPHVTARRYGRCRGGRISWAGCSPPAGVRHGDNRNSLRLEPPLEYLLHREALTAVAEGPDRPLSEQVASARHPVPNALDRSLAGESRRRRRTDGRTICAPHTSKYSAVSDHHIDHAGTGG
ncbi:hypothetical protein SAMN04487905_113114 [Actinopolyspora xinjiangensis]|uniref:Uncharacterized protein n=1 Tax=Actinopolyspora xinjiangensis TaxID=405564 RepID=A0A1H0WPL8_9ACTN|nr:hypothetical protein SAMN04487905_113114 [Actinopolyspora xinjiangensis]